MTTLKIGNQVKLTEATCKDFPTNRDVEEQQNGQKLVITSISPCGNFYRLNGRKLGFCVNRLEVIDGDLVPHKHADVIHAWADGKQIQVSGHTGWEDIKLPRFYPSGKYRVKPSEQELKRIELEDAVAKAQAELDEFNAQ